MSYSPPGPTFYTFEIPVEIEEDKPELVTVECRQNHEAEGLMAVCVWRDTGEGVKDVMDELDIVTLDSIEDKCNRQHERNEAFA